jgi:glycosyltransferase involved in cell wall biosynthesis
MSPRISILTPSHNRADLLPQTIDSVLRQSCGDFEMIVVDDGSTDATRDVVEGYRDPRLLFVGLPHVGNLSKLRNAGVERARGELVAFLDSDDLWHDDKLQEQVELFDRHPDVGWSFCGYESFDANGPLRRNVFGEEEREALVDWIFPTVIRGGMTIYTSTVMARRSLLAEAGPFNEELLIADFELFTRLAFLGKAAVLRRPLTRIRKHAGNCSSDLARGIDGFRDAIHSIESFHARGAISRELRAEMLVKYRYRLGKYLLTRGRPAEARRELLACLRLRPWYLPAWNRWARSFL